MKLITLLVTSNTFFLMITPGLGAVIYNESINGDLSGLFGSPTTLNLTTGANTIIAQMGSNGNTGATNGSDADYFTVTVGSGESLVSITVDSYLFSPNNPGVSFAGYVAAPVFAGQTAQNINGSVLFNASSGNILDDFTGGPATLGPGTYSFWFQETSANLISYQLTYNLVPEPSSALIGACSIGLCLASRRRPQTL
ncbi:MAG: hypothetical protein WEB53_10410 [Akkermansiaceae bacterium]